MLIDPAKITTYITTWLRNYANDNYKKCFVVGVSGGLDSAVTAILCIKSGVPTHLYHQKCFIDPEEIRDIIPFSPESYRILEEPIDSNLSYTFAQLHGRLGSIADKETGLLVGTISRTKGNLARFYTKRGDDSADIFPIMDLYKAEIYQLYKYLTNNEFINESVIELHPELLKHEIKLNLEYHDIEWADKENIKNNIIERDDLPDRDKLWYRYFLKQKEILFRLHQYEKNTRHKLIAHKPICQLRNLIGSII